MFYALHYCNCNFALDLRTDWLKMSESLFVQKDNIKSNESGAVFTNFNFLLTHKSAQ